MSSTRENKCKCGLPVVIRKSWTPDNPGRRFEGCQKFKPHIEWGCDHFKWFDQDQTQWQKEVIWELQNEKRMWDNAFIDVSKVIPFMQAEKDKANAEIDALKLKNYQLLEDWKLAKRSEETVKGVVMFCCAIVCGCMCLCINKLLL